MTSSLTAVPLFGGPESLTEAITSPGKGRARRWENRYRWALAGTDAVAGACGAAVAYLVRPGSDSVVWSGDVYAGAGVLTPLLWAGVLAVVRSRDPGRLGVFAADRRDLTVAVLLLVAAVAWLTWATTIQVPRDFVLLTLAVSAGAGLAGRGALRMELRSRRARGLCQQRILAVGRVRSVDALIRQVGRDRNRGARVVGCCVPVRADADAALYLGGVPVLGGFDDVADALRTVDADTVAVLPCPELDPVDLRRLAWSVERYAPRFVMIPGLVDVAGPRLAVGGIGDLPALHVRQARLTGPGLVVKGLADRLLALLALVALAPVLAVLALLIRLTSPGPALFRQTRVGLCGREFTLVKFRTMHTDAEQRRADLLPHNINDDGLLFKVRDDPRVTRVGAVLRLWSLDELPQLVNILAGHMSLVGPRPSLPAEVADYGPDVSRRLAVKPGLTGLWQISGRSDLSWEESVRLDLHYVDNWSLGLDLFVLYRTVPAVVNRTGAY